MRNLRLSLPRIRAFYAENKQLASGTCELSEISCTVLIACSQLASPRRNPLIVRRTVTSSERISYQFVQRP